MDIKLGQLRVRNIDEGDGALPFSMAMPQISAADFAALKAWYWSEELATDPAAAQFKLIVRSYVLQVGGLNVMVDTCNGNDKQRSVPFANQLQKPYLADLAALGLQPEDIHLVLCTHLHADHVGWNTRLDNGHWVPTFPNARYVFSRQDYEYFKEQTHEAFHREAYLDSVLPVIAAGRAQLVETNHKVYGEIEDGIWLEAAPGHSPGCCVVHARRGAQQAVFSGDVFHHPIQLVRPDIPFFADHDPAAASVTRQRLLERHADGESVFFPAHFPDSPAGKVRRAAQGYRYDFLQQR
jgi:glyoxylase-like metal-dependent hydrolase (beta-lactamase superfamily II)